MSRVFIYRMLLADGLQSRIAFWKTNLEYVYLQDILLGKCHISYNYNQNYLCIWNIWWISLEFSSIILNQTALVQCRLKKKTRGIILHVAVFLVSLCIITCYFKIIRKYFALVMTIIHANLIWQCKLLCFNSNIHVCTHTPAYSQTIFALFKVSVISVTFLTIKTHI